jgi:hypothetical protein
MRHSMTVILFSLLILAVPAFAHTNAGELSQNCDAITAKRSDVWDVDRTTKGGFCAGYLNAVFDFVDSSPDFEVLRDIDVAAMMECLQRYAPKHSSEPADKAVVNALIGEGYLKRRAN